jgi:hypothetical protein
MVSTRQCRVAESRADIPRSAALGSATIADLVSHITTRVLDQFNLSAPDAHRWDGIPAPAEPLLSAG